LPKKRQRKKTGSLVGRQKGKKNGVSGQKTGREGKRHPGSKKTLLNDLLALQQKKQ